MIRILPRSAVVLGLWFGCTAAARPGVADTPPRSEAVLPNYQDSSCRPAGKSLALPVEVRETSGLARGRRDPSVLWTHNDSGFEPILYALNTEGRILGRVRVQGATLVDWEDIAAGPCGRDSCLFIADIGDNGRAREFVTVYAVPEPAVDARSTAPARQFRLRFPDGAQDAEAMFILPSGALYLVSKGRHGAIRLYRAPEGYESGSVATLEPVKELWPMPRDERNRVTSATATPDGKWVAIRTYRTLYVYPTAELVAGRASTPMRVDLAPLREKQGESVTATDDGTVWLTSEAERKKDVPSMSRLECRFAVTTSGSGQ